MRWAIGIVGMAGILGGCLGAQGGAAEGAGGTGVARGEGVIFVGQGWGEARQVAEAAGYRLEDASGLQRMPTAEGFYVNLAGGRGLVVIRDARRDAVKSVEWEEGWNGPRGLRVEHVVGRFVLPRAE